MTLALLLLRWLWPVLVLGGAYLWADNGWHNAVAKRLQTQLSAVTLQRDKAQAEIEAMNTAAFRQQERWSNVVTAQEKRAATDATQRAKADLPRRAADARSDPVSRAVPVPDSTRRMLGDAYQAARAAEAARAPEQAAPANSATVADLSAWGVQMIAWAQECQARVLEWELFYSGLQEEQ